MSINIKARNGVIGLEIMIGWVSAMCVVFSLVVDQLD